jgi:hypothetical protein
MPDSLAIDTIILEKGDLLTFLDERRLGSFPIPHQVRQIKCLPRKC